MGGKNGVDRMDKNKSRTDLLAAGRKKVQIALGYERALGFLTHPMYSMP